MSGTLLLNASKNNPIHSNMREFKLTSHCPCIALVSSATPGMTALNREKPVVFKMLIQLGPTWERNKCRLFRENSGHHCSSSGLIRLSTVRPIGETLLNWHGNYCIPLFGCHTRIKSWHKVGK